jgi:hypothetical protein
MHLHPQGQAQKARSRFLRQARCVPLTSHLNPLFLALTSTCVAIFAGRDDGDDSAAPSKKHAEDGKPVEDDDADNEGEPNKILFVQNLPESAPPAAITAALKQVLIDSMLLTRCHIYVSEHVVCLLSLF